MLPDCSERHNATEPPASWCDITTRHEHGEVDLIREIFARFHASDSLKGVAA
jgi:hypothetical protein